MAASQPGEDRLARMAALVIDDSETVRQILAGYLQTMGFSVTLAANGREGLGCLREMAKVDLVLVDWNMPELDGLSFIRAVRGLEDYAALPVMMVTTNTELSQVSRALDAGANEYIMKPCTAAMVRDKLDLLGLLG